MKIKNLLTVSLLASLLVACKGGEAPMQQGGAASPCEVLNITPQTISYEQSYPASIRGKQSVDIRPKVGGFIDEILVEEGQAVRKGEVLMRIFNDEYKQNVVSAEANLKQSEADVAVKELDYEKSKSLFAKNIVSDYDVKAAKLALEASKARVEQAKAALKTAKVDLEYTYIKSPTAGVIGMIPYKVGALVSSSMTTPLTTVSDMNDMYAYFSLSEADLLGLMQGAEGRSLKEVMNHFSDVKLVLINGHAYDKTGKLDVISGVVDQTTGSVGMRAKFVNSNALLRNGASATVVLPVEVENAVVIPQAATVEMQDKKFAYKVGADSLISLVPIAVNKVPVGNSYLVEQGLAPGDVIAVKGTINLRPGMKIAPMTKEQMQAAQAAQAQAQAQAQQQGATK